MNYLELPEKEYDCNFELQINEIFSLNQGNTAVVQGAGETTPGVFCAVSVS